MLQVLIEAFYNDFRVSWKPGDIFIKDHMRAGTLSLMKHFFQMWMLKKLPIKREKMSW